MSEAELRRLVSAAVVQDFIDDLPRPLGVAELAVRLRRSRASVMHHIRRGHLVARRAPDQWIIDVEASDQHLREMISGVGVRRPAVPASGLGRAQTVYVPIRGAVLDRLTTIMEREHSTAERVIEDLLTERVGSEAR